MTDVGGDAKTSVVRPLFAKRRPRAQGSNIAGGSGSVAAVRLARNGDAPPGNTSTPSAAAAADVDGGGVAHQTIVKRPVKPIGSTGGRTIGVQTSVQRTSTTTSGAGGSGGGGVVRKKIARPANLDVEEADEDTVGAAVSGGARGIYSTGYLASLKGNTRSLPSSITNRRAPDGGSAAKPGMTHEAVWDRPSATDVDADDGAHLAMEEDDFIPLSNANTMRNAGIGYDGSTKPGSRTMHDADADADDELEAAGFGDDVLAVGDAARMVGDRRRRAEMADMLRDAQLSDGSDSDAPRPKTRSAADDDDDGGTSDDEWEQTQLDRMTASNTTTAAARHSRLDGDGVVPQHRRTRRQMERDRAERCAQRRAQRPIPTLSFVLSRIREEVAQKQLDMTSNRERVLSLKRRQKELEEVKNAIKRDLNEMDAQALQVLQVYAPAVYNDVVKLYPSRNTGTA